MTENVSGHIKIVLTPKDVYNIFCKFHNKSLSANYKIILPEKYKHTTYPLSIEIQIKFEHNDEFDTRTITLEPEFIPLEQIIISQLEWRDKLFQSRMDKRYKQFELSLNERDKQIEELATEIRILRSQTKTEKQIEEQFKLSLAQRDEQIEKLANEIEILHSRIETNETHRLTDANILEKKVDEKFREFSIISVLNGVDQQIAEISERTNDQLKEMTGIYDRNLIDIMGKVDDLSNSLNSCVKVGTVYTKKETDDKFQISTKRLQKSFKEYDIDEDDDEYIFNKLPDFSIAVF